MYNQLPVNYNSSQLLLVKIGRLLRKNMRQELITEDELMTQLHRAGDDNLADVAEAQMEGDGSSTVIPRQSD